MASEWKRRSEQMESEPGLKPREGRETPRAACGVLIRAFSILCLLATLSSSCAGPVEAPAPKWTSGDEKVDALVERLMRELGGEENWAQTRFIRFDFADRRTHHWDKRDGKHRLDGQTREGQAYTVLLDLNSRDGSAYLDGVRLEGEEKAEWLERAYGAWINDTYWLLMPYKMKDPGVTLRYDGDEELEGRLYDKVLLSFDGVGLTPGDRYWAYLNRETGLMDRWAYILQNQDPDGPATHWVWSGWREHGGIMLASERRDPDSDRSLPLGNIAVLDQLSDEVFSSPQPVQ